MSKAPPPPLNWWKLLPVSAKTCPKDGEALHWEVFAGMRIRSNGVYKALCPKCHRHFDVLAPREPRNA